MWLCHGTQGICGRVSIRNPAQIRGEVCSIDNVRILGFGVPTTGSKRGYIILLSGRGDPIDSQGLIVLGAPNQNCLG